MASGSDRKLAALRRRIDALDRALVRLLKKRLALARDAARFKSRVLDRVREAAVARRASRLAGADRKPVLQIYRAVIGACRRAQIR
ncbi:MAG: chorismate mutase [Elusimicrobiota bacterium]|jgi:chorismate mutase